jgi:cyclic pyranopterin phosphate synthase
MTDSRPADVASAPAPGPGITATVPFDRLGRQMHDLRISVTDRCNFRCTYCMPAEVFGRDHAFLPRGQILTFEEIARLARLFVALGVEKLRITGGEPTARRDLPDLVRMLAAIDGVRDLTLTTNGSALRRLAAPLAEAGLRRITVSLDSLDDEVFRRLNGVGFPVGDVLDGIEAARDAGLAPIKVNMVVRRGANEESVVPVARWAREAGLVLRFIEFMDVGQTNGWRMDEVVPGAEILARLDAALPLEALPARYPGEVARRFSYRDGRGEVGVITSVSAPFCGACTRARLTADGGLFGCLFGAHGADLKSPLRAGETDDELLERIRSAWAIRADRYSELRAAGTADLPRVEMFAMGG